MSRIIPIAITVVIIVGGLICVAATVLFCLNNPTPEAVCGVGVSWVTSGIVAWLLYDEFGPGS